MEDIDWGRALAELAEAVDAVAARLRSLGEGRLTRPPMQVGIGVPVPSRSDGPAVAERALVTAQVLADLAADLEGRPSLSVPKVGVLAVGDQVAVVGRDLVAALQACSPQDAAAVAALHAGAAAVRDLRSAI